MRLSYLRYISVLLLFALSILCAPTAEGGTDKGKFTIVLDAGHGGHDPGAVGRNFKEKDICLKVVLEVGRLLNENCSDVRVIYTRKTDVYIPLKTRADIANHNKADLFISVHTNAVRRGRTVYGTETYTLGMSKAAGNLEVAKRENSVITYEKGYQETYEGFDPNKVESYIIFELMQDKYMKQSVDLAQCIQQQYVRQGRKNRGVRQAGLLVLYRATMPAILTELGFISTPEEERYLNSSKGIQAFARSIYNGIMRYRDSQGGGAPAPVQPIDDAAETADEAPHQEAVAATDNKPVFKVQLFASKEKLKGNDRRLKGLTPVDCYQENGHYKYTYGESADYNEISRVRKSIAKKFPDTFIVAFLDGKRIDTNEARRLSKKK